MPPKSLEELLNRTIYSSRLDSHWAASSVEFLKLAFYDLDPMGLRGFHLPTNEYEGEAVVALAIALNHSNPDDFLVTRVPPSVFPERSNVELADAISQSFSLLFDEDLIFDERDAMTLATREAWNLMLQMAPSNGITAADSL